MLVNSKKMLEVAFENKKAVPQFNINNLEWAKYILEECQKQNYPVILGVSEGAKKYMGGFVTVTNLVKGLIQDLNITIDVCLHLDHGTTFDVCKEAIDAGFTSVMIDASQNSLEENIRITKEVVAYAKPKGVTVEGEVGIIGGEEDGIVGEEKWAVTADCIRYYNETDIDTVAPALGSVHGLYNGEPNLNFESMKEISEALNIPLVLHGGSGIPDYQIEEAISCGISKINVNTELQVEWHAGVLKFIAENPKAYDPRKVIGSGEESLKHVVEEKITLFSNK